MKTTMKLFAASLKEMILIYFFSFILINFIAYVIFTLILKIPYEEFLQRNWIILVFVPLIQAIIQPLINKNGLLTVEKTEKSEIIVGKIETLLKKMDYCEKKRDSKSTQYAYNKKWKQILHILFNGNITLNIDADSIKIYGKKNILGQLEHKLRFE